MALQEEMEKQGLWLFRYRSTLPLLLLAGGLSYYLWSKMHHIRPFPENSRSEEWFLYVCMAVSFLG
ncbi:MAG TPA: lipid A phosphate methyltransferase, partial [Bacteroidia bacterium]|nr:lipid A phosphate methyltransferase [Bacteroidia bacterium]